MTSEAPPISTPDLDPQTDLQDHVQRLLLWEEHGAVFPIFVMSEDEAAAALDQLRQFETALGHPVTGNTRFNSHLVLGWVWDLATCGAVLDHVEQILGPDIMLWSSDWVIKQASTPGFFSFHQDGTYCGLQPASDMVTVWIALTPSTQLSGCVHFALGSHTCGQLPHTETVGKVTTADDPAAQNNMLSRGQTVAKEHFLQDGGDTVPAVLRPGEASIHSSFVVHASGPNDSDTDRVGLAFRYVRPSAVPDKPVGATLVRGVDCFHHFETVAAGRPEADMDEQGWEAHRKAMELENAVIFDNAPTGEYRH